MVDAGDALGFAETAVGLGATMFFAGMAMKFTKDMTDNLIEQGKKQPKMNKPFGKPLKLKHSRKPQQKKGGKKRQPQPYNPFSARNLNKQFRY